MVDTFEHSLENNGRFGDIFQCDITIVELSAHQFVFNYFINQIIDGLFRGFF
ncbi:hypothetical protein D3C80_1437740 [compost metagenome]